MGQTVGARPARPRPTPTPRAAGQFLAGGDTIGETVEGLQRFPINLRYPREIRDSLEKLCVLPIVTEKGARLVLSDVADIRITDGPPMLRSENARLSGWVYVDIRGPWSARATKPKSGSWRGSVLTLPLAPSGEGRLYGVSLKPGCTGGPLR